MTAWWIVVAQVVIVAQVAESRAQESDTVHKNFESMISSCLAESLLSDNPLNINMTSLGCPKRV